MTNKNDKILASVCVILLIVSLAFFSYIKTNEESEETIDEILEATIDYTSGNTKKYITAESLYDLINDDNITNDPYIISIRNAENYSRGHIPGAVNIGLGSIFTEENLEKLPKDRLIVVYCYTGHTASQATALLNVNGYDAYSLKWGMCSWTDNSTIAANKYFTGGGNYPVVSDIINGNSYSPPGSINTISSKNVPLKPLACGGDTAPPADDKTDTDDKDTSDTDAEALREASYDAALAKPYVIKAPDLYNILTDTDSSNDPYILDLRIKQEDKPDYYAEGHIEGAINIGLGSLFDEENLEKLPKNKQIVVVCYTGHTASQATALLNLNGYDATTLMWGMCSWTTDNNVVGSYCFNQTKDSKGYSVSSGIWDEEVLGVIYSSLNPMKKVAITADSLYENLWDEDTSDDPFILSIRKTDAYELGHIPGAVNYGTIAGLFTNANLAKLPVDKQIVVVCYTGHTASQATALLNSLGFNATALKFGMCGWCANTTIAPMGFERTSPNYPICTGSDPGTIDIAEAADI